MRSGRAARTEGSGSGHTYFVFSWSRGQLREPGKSRPSCVRCAKEDGETFAAYACREPEPQCFLPWVIHSIDVNVRPRKHWSLLVLLFGSYRRCDRDATRPHPQSSRTDDECSARLTTAGSERSSRMRGTVDPATPSWNATIGFESSKRASSPAIMRQPLQHGEPQELLWASPSFFEEAEFHFYAALSRASSCDRAPSRRRQAPRPGIKRRLPAARGMGGELSAEFREPRRAGRRRDCPHRGPRARRHGPLRARHPFGARKRLCPQRGDSPTSWPRAFTPRAASRRSQTLICGRPGPAIYAGAPTERCGNSISSIRG